MRLFSALVPPGEVLDDVARVVHSVAPGSRELDAVPATAMHIPISLFGNVTLSDARALRATLPREAVGWTAPKLWFAGAAALEWPGDQSVWAKLEGDVDELFAIARGVADVVRRLGFLVDRRKFRPWLSVGTITDHTTAPYLERLVAALDGFQGRPWRLEEVCLLRSLPLNDDGTDGGFEIVDRVPLRVE